ncbi:ATP-binding protein [Aurantimicrobium minutum]|uniref:ATP-binding protein n=1 Tax=Aurantimicrobium minutum TaxID=708131 RepID=UPI00247531DA|nr:ATP-binding protein [Aurantimicrobium minutum]MDH6536930.1 hypothetical protein [Aurantimicrobium minutum]
MKDTESIPDPSLFLSMRALDYTLPSALADIIDNSITADAKNVDIFFDSENDEPYIAILDDGNGMNHEELKSAMKLGGKSPLFHRPEDELGRFGLGLKTASLSQARTLTVLSKENEQYLAMQWDLDHLASTGSWKLQELDEKEIKELPVFVELEKLNTGTLVLWRNLDNLGYGSANFSESLDAELAKAKEHISLVFHRFLNGDQGISKLNICINYSPITGADPFLPKSKRTDRGPEQKILVGTHFITVQAFTLPYSNQMSQSEREVASVAGGLRESQGFYVYRANRLITWGTWFKLTPTKELGKLSRVKVDVPNSMDHLWKLTVTKTRVIPPLEIREALKKLTENFTVQSKKVFKHKGEVLVSSEDGLKPWEVTKDRDDSLIIKINRGYPLLDSFTDGLDKDQLIQLSAILTAVEIGLPKEALYLELTKDQSKFASPDVTSSLVISLFDLWKSHNSTFENETDFIDKMLAISPFDTLKSERTSLINQLSSEGA